MRLTTFSDYAFRVLIYIGSVPGRLSTIDEIARAYRISPNHLMKVVHYLGQERYVETVRGKGGGMRLARPAHEINVGAVLRATEEDFRLVECFQDAKKDGKKSDCRIASACVLKHALGEALEAFLKALDGYTLADLVGKMGSVPIFAVVPIFPARRDAGRRARAARR